MTDQSTQPPLPDLPPGLAERVLAILEAHPAGLDELALLRRLAETYPESLFAEPDALREPLKLFRVHFLLFHTLYRLADGLAERGQGLRIGAMRIALEARLPGQIAMARVDPLRAYYLDWQHWAATQGADVDRLLDAFWQGVRLPDEQTAAAHELFGLTAPVSGAVLRRRYRELASAHHPDRGGDTATAQQINGAYLILKRYYGLR